jgi:hypothetical protein
MDDTIVGMVGALVSGIALASTFIATIASNPDPERRPSPRVPPVATRRWGEQPEVLKED